MTTVAFLGLGLMGTPMAARLLQCGHRVTVWDRDPAKTVPLGERGAATAPTPSMAVANSTAVITMLADGAAVRDVLAQAYSTAARAPGATPAPGPGPGPGPGVLIQSSTVSPAELDDVAAVLHRQTRLLDAPVLGSIPQALSGQLRILVGGEQETYEQCRSVLQALGEPVFVGPAGNASALKLVLNAAVAPMVALLGEALALGDALGLDERLVLDELARSRIGPLVRRKRAAITSGHFPPDSRLALFGKDMRLVVETGRARGVEMRMAAVARTLAESAIAAGAADLDYSALVAVLRGHHPASS